jgi:multidrug transporter EmrE-like cation transporter
MMFPWLALSAIWFGLGGYLSKRWVAHPSPGLLIALIVAFMASTLSWLPALQVGKDLIAVGTASIVMCSIATLIVGAACFGERLGWHNGLGMLLAVIAIILLRVH